MDKLKDFIKKNHLIAYLVTMIVLVVLGYCVKWYHHPQIAEEFRGRAADFYKYFEVMFVIFLIGVSAMFFVIVSVYNYE